MGATLRHARFNEGESQRIVGARAGYDCFFSTFFLAFQCFLIGFLAGQPIIPYEIIHINRIGERAFAKQDSQEYDLPAREDIRANAVTLCGSDYQRTVRTKLGYLMRGQSTK